MPTPANLAVTLGTFQDGLAHLAAFLAFLRAIWACLRAFFSFAIFVPLLVGPGQDLPVVRGNQDPADDVKRGRGH